MKDKRGEKRRECGEKINVERRKGEEKRGGQRTEGEKMEVKVAVEKRMMATNHSFVCFNQLYC